MMLLKDLLYRVNIERIQGDRGLAIESVAFDSRKVARDGLFVAVRGTQLDGHQFVLNAIDLGAKAVVLEKWMDKLPANITQIQVDNSAQALGVIASNFYGTPSEKMQVVAVTGTNGKTTVASLLHELSLALDRKAGLLSTVINKIGKEEAPATHTTPDPLQIHALLAQMRDKGCKYVFMEASSHGIVQERLSGIRLRGAIFTNISRDHLDYHGSMDEYVRAKKMLFDQLTRNAFALCNWDDRHGRTMTMHCSAKVYGYALKTPADYQGKILEGDFNGSLLRFNEDELWTPLIGPFNAYNLLAIYSAAELLGLSDKQQMLTALSLLKAVSGRFQHVQSDRGIIGIVDYAHTPDALENVCKTIKSVTEKGQRLMVVVGCGGDRDAGKRPMMAQIAARYAHRSIFTADNPRTEAPDRILDDMEAGLELDERSRTLRIADRKEAIKTACHLAEVGDIVLVAGKGHENYQEIDGKRHPFSDLEVLAEQLNSPA
jgi:UDP-N-acetylmuramoyl-L-alanyl-D-glutamate--2,6-diaminopimelate ligase